MAIGGIISVSARGFCFIRTSHDDIFAPASAFPKDTSINKYLIGRLVDYEEKMGPKGRYATSVRFRNDEPEHGVVTRLSDNWGFIASDAGDQIFFNHRACNLDFNSCLGRRVTFNRLAQLDKHPIALNVQQEES